FNPCTVHQTHAAQVLPTRKVCRNFKAARDHQRSASVGKALLPERCPPLEAQARLTRAERKPANNGIRLCVGCATLIDEDQGCLYRGANSGLQAHRAKKSPA